MVRRLTQTLAVVVAVLCIGCAGTLGTMGTSNGTGAAVGEASDTPRGDYNIQNSNGFWDTGGWHRGSYFGENPALSNPEPPGFNRPGGGHGE